MTPIEFFLPGPTFSWREKKKKRTGQHPAVKGNSMALFRVNGQPRISPSGRTRAAQAALVKALLEVPERPLVPWAADIRLDVLFVLGVPASWPRWKREAALDGAIRPTATGRGDRGNYLKMFEDGLEGAGFLADDGQICAGEVGKAYGPLPGFRIRLEALPAGPTSAAEARELSATELF